MPDDALRPEDIPRDMPDNMALVRQLVERARQAPEPDPEPEPDEPQPPDYPDERRSPVGEGPMDPAAMYQDMGGQWPGDHGDGVDPDDPWTFGRAGDGDPVPRPRDWARRSPVVPLGTSNGVFYYLDPLGQVRALGETHGRSQLIALFAPLVSVLENWWPRRRALKSGGEVAGWEWIGCDWDKAAIDLVSACAQRGVWTPFDRVRGVGAWRGEDGELVLHCGDTIWRGRPPDVQDGDPVWMRPGLLGRHVYAAGDAQPRPDYPECYPDQAALSQAARDLSDILRTWRWQRKNDWLLLLGWIGAAMVGGALSWRPAVWLTGDAGTGKSTLQKVVHGVLGATLVQSADASGAGIWQVVGMSSRPVAIDELEPSDNPARTKAVIDLARQAASGAVILRGGQDHNGVQFRANSAFLFSSILIPPMTQADRSRLAMLELDPLPEGVDTPDLTPGRLAAIGAALRMRLCQRWAEVHQTIEKFRRGLAGVGHVARAADQFGTLLAIAYLLRSDEPLTAEKVAEICKPLAADALTETAERLADWQEMLLHLGSRRVDAYKGGRKPTIGSLIAAAGMDCRPDSADASDAREANDALGPFGLKVVQAGDVKYELPALRVLAVANKTHSGLSELFTGTKWASGVWEQSAGRVPGAKKAPAGLRFDGQLVRCTLIPLDHVLDPTAGRPAQDNGTTAAPAADVRSTIGGADGAAGPGVGGPIGDAASHYPPPEVEWPEPPGFDPDPFDLGGSS